MSQAAQREKLVNYFDRFITEHAIQGGGQFILDITPQEAEELGYSFVRVICGWMAGVDHVRSLREPVPDETLPTELLIELLCKVSGMERLLCMVSGMERRIMQRLDDALAMTDESKLLH
ncbi:MAG: hypothetical protein J2P21_31585 [Chloracidobacterium sp.]|nr:hypothetical protein [Chloracidobacterium sp.]